MSNFYLFALTLTACLTSFGLGITSMILWYLHCERKQELEDMEAELAALLPFPDRK
jgi:hypothetical protein